MEIQDGVLGCEIVCSRTRGLKVRGSSAEIEFGAEQLLDRMRVNL